MRRLLALLLPLALVLPASAQKETDTDARAKAVAPLLDELTLAVVHVDLNNLDLDALLARVGKVAHLDEDRLAKIKKEGAKHLKTLRDAGIRDVYGVVSLEGISTQPRTFLVVPLTGDADAAAMSKALHEMIPLPSAKIGSALVLGEAGVLRRLKDLTPVAHPGLGKAFAAAGAGTLQAAVMMPRSLRRSLEEAMPDLPKEIGGGSIKTVTQGFSWAAVGLKLEPKPSLQMTIQARDADTAQQLAVLYENVLNGYARELAKDKAAEELLSSKALRELLTPKVKGDRLTLLLNEKDLTSVLLPMVAKMRGAAQTSQSMNNLKQMGLAMHNYHSTYHSFPPHASYDKNGKPLLSWRVHILPFVEQDQLYKQFHLDEPWDSNHNKALIAMMPETYRDPASKAAKGKTIYVVPVGKQTIFPPGPKGMRIQDITDGTSNTFLILTVDDDHAVVWTKPDDLAFDPKKPLEGLAGKAQGRFVTAFADGSVRAISRTIKLADLRALFTRNGGEALSEEP